MVGFVTNNMAEVPPDMAHNAVNTQNAPAGSFGDIAEASFNNSITPAILGYSGLLGSRIGNQLRDQPLPKLSPQDIEGKYGIKVDAPMEDYEAKYISDAQHNEKQYQMATQNASGLKTFAADSVAFLADPINLGSMFIPIAGQARVGAALGLDAGTIAGRAATRAITFGTAGAVSQAPLSAIKYGLSQTQHTDYSIADAMRDTLFAGVTGAIAGPLFGGLKDAIMGNPRWADTVERFQRMKYGDNEAVAQVGQAQMAKENLVEIDSMIPKPRDYDSIFTPEGRAINPTDTLASVEHYEAPIGGVDYAGQRGEKIQQLIAMKDQLEKWPDTQAPTMLAQKMSLEYKIRNAEKELGLDKPPIETQPAVTTQQFIESQHENGVMGLGKQELAKTIEATHVEPEVQDPHTEAEKMQAQADQLEVSLREKSDVAAMEEHDAWKDKQSTLDKAYQALHECLMR